MGWIGAISEGSGRCFLSRALPLLEGPAPSQLWSCVLNTGQGGQQPSAPRTAAWGAGGGGCNCRLISRQHQGQQPEG